ncbi:DUF3526 domain-containing protein [uncultured Sphingomonas sp.]|uniref:DUF3526 domain-containing protein n=1 Tax=uncultured Sphingomonas sp. TaxID=158754 RepID=UPI0035CA1691
MKGWRVFRWELRIVLRERLLPIVFVTLALAALMATLNGQALTRQWSAVTDRYAASAAAGEAALLKTLAAGKPTAEEAGSVRTSYLRPAPPLLGLAGGRAMLDPIAVTAAPTDQLYHLFRDYQTDNPWPLVIGRFDWAFLLAVIVPLLIIALGYDLLARDRDLGVDRQLALGGCGRGTLLATRTLARAVPLALAVLVLIVVAIQVTGSGAAGWPRVSALLALATGGMIFWWGLVALVNLRHWSAARSAAVLLSAWTMLAFVVPALVDAAAQAIAPSPSRIELTIAARTAEITAQANAVGLVDRYLAGNPGLPRHPDDAAQRSDARFAVSLEIDRAVAPALARFNATLARQHRVASMLQFLSPVGAEQSLMTEIAGTGFAARARFQEDVNRHYLAWRDAVASLQFAGRPLSRARIESLPRFPATSASSLPLIMLTFFFVILIIPAVLTTLSVIRRQEVC